MVCSGAELEFVQSTGLVAPFKSNAFTVRMLVAELVPAGVTVTVDAPSTTVVRVSTAQGPFNFRLIDLQDGHPLVLREGDVIVQQTPTPRQVSAESVVYDSH